MVGTIFRVYVLTIYSFEFTAKMKTSYFCVLLISALVLQISSAEPTELEELAASFMHSLVDIVEIPYRKLENILNPSVAGEKKEPFLKDIIVKLKRKNEEFLKAYLESLPHDRRECLKKQIAENLHNSQKIVNSIQETSNTVKLIINTYFNTLPKNVQNKLFELGKDLINIANKIKEFNN